MNKKVLITIIVVAIVLVSVVLGFVFTTPADNGGSMTTTTTTTTTTTRHEHHFDITITNPTCTSAGYTTYVCECGTSYKDDYINSLGHDWNEATCIVPKTCSVCNITEGTVLEHKWEEATCITPYTCSVCGTTDGKPKGHFFVEGECFFCSETDPDYIPLILTATKTNLNLTDDSETIYFTKIGGDSLTYEIEDTNIVKCEWGEWDSAHTIPLTFTPVSNGETTVTVYITDTDESVIINVSVERAEPTLTFDQIGKEYKDYPSYGSLSYNVNVVNSASYTVDQYSNGNIAFNVELIVSMVEYNTSSGYIDIDYELYNEDGVCVDTGKVWVDCKYIGRSYTYDILFYVKRGNYTLVFYDTYN